MGENVTAGTAWSKVDVVRKSRKSPFLSPRPTEARTFIFHYEITHMLLKWPKNSKGPHRGIQSANCISSERSFTFRGEKSGSKQPRPVLGRFGEGFRTPFCAHPAHAWRMMPLFGHFWSKCQSSGGLGGRKHPPGHRPGEGGYAKITKIAGFRGSPSQG